MSAVVAAVTLAGARWSGRPTGVLLLALALVWLPWAIFLLVGSSHSGRIRFGRLVIYGGPLGDVLIVFAAQCLVPWAWGILLLADAMGALWLCHGNLARDMWKRAGHGRDHAAVAACQSAWASALNVRSVRREIR